MADSDIHHTRSRLNVVEDASNPPYSNANVVSNPQDKDAVYQVCDFVLASTSRSVGHCGSHVVVKLILGIII